MTSLAHQAAARGRWGLSGLVWALLSAALLAPEACAAAGSAGSAPGEQGTLRVFVSILPQKHFAERVGGDRVAVEVLVGPGRSPATYEPTPRQMTRLAAADLLVTSGVPFEAVWLPRLARAHPDLAIVDGAAGIARLPMNGHRHGDAEEPHAGGHEQHPTTNAGPGQDHAGHEPTSGGLADPHVWTSPANASAMAQRIAGALAAVDPAGARQYADGAAAFAAEMTALDIELGERLAGLAGRRFLVFHPSWGYFARAYGLEQVAIEADGKEPGARALAALIASARAEGVRAVFVQAQFSRALADRVAAEIGAEVVVADPLAEDYAANLRRVASALEEALR